MLGKKKKGKTDQNDRKDENKLEEERDFARYSKRR